MIEYESGYFDVFELEFTVGAALSVDANAPIKGYAAKELNGMAANLSVCASAVSKDGAAANKTIKMIEYESGYFDVFELEFIVGAVLSVEADAPIKGYAAKELNGMAANLSVCASAVSKDGAAANKTIKMIENE